ncbi:hypothetical protein TNCV_3797251 [Trichonephila clavipes]|nr:hypothetical protein TNCV_3797251 [Trichonephila clavipes]
MVTPPISTSTILAGKRRGWKYSPVPCTRDSAHKDFWAHSFNEHVLRVYSEGIVRLLEKLGGRRRDSLGVKVMDSWPACHEFEPSTTEDSPCGGVMDIKSESQMSSRWCRVEVRRRGCMLRYRNRHMTMVLNYVVRFQNPSSSLTVRR